MPTKTKTKPAARSAEPKDETPEPMKPETPDWVNETPDERVYALNVTDSFGGGEQDVKMTRGEFIRLKRCLAALRGYELRAPLDHWGIAHSEEGRDAALLNITQEEIQMVMDLEYASDMLFLNLRKRLRLGATVESGKWKVWDQDGDIESDEGPVSGSCCRGLNIIETREAETATATT